MSATYGWIITCDLITTDEDHRRHTASGGREGLPTREGWTGPRDIRPAVEKQLQAGKGRRFKMYDDDGNLCYEGRYLGPDQDSDGEEMFGPLNDLGTPDAGATRIDYENLAPGGAWGTL